MIWFTADTHYDHENIIKYCNRPFNTVEEMNKELVNRWNAVVTENDVVYHLGDVTLRGWKTARKFFRQVNGHVNVIPGSHDYRWLSQRSNLDGLHVLPPIYTLEFDTGEKYLEAWVLCHYAMRVWDRSHYGSFHLYGHSHGTLQPQGRSLDVGVDCRRYTPVSIDQLRTVLSTRTNPNELCQH